MSLHCVRGNSQRLDGGSMFGNCPRALWQRWCAPDEAHRIELACRCLLVRDEAGRQILFETGIGAFFDPKMRERYGVQEAQHVLLDSLVAAGTSAEEVDIIVLSHLHFDHAGGLLRPWAKGTPPALAFPRAHYVISEAAWRRARQPHARDRASFIPGLCDLLEATGRLELVRSTRSERLGNGYRFSFSEGHTPGLMLTRIETSRGPLTFMGDLVPGVPWVHLPITMGYDRFPEKIIEEKRTCLEAMAQEDGWAFFTHDPNTAAARISQDDRGRFIATEPIEKLRWPA